VTSGSTDPADVVIVEATSVVTTEDPGLASLAGTDTVLARLDREEGAWAVAQAVVVALVARVTCRNSLEAGLSYTQYVKVLI